MTTAAGVLGLLFGGVFAVAVAGQSAPADGPRYMNGTDLVRPLDYREWPFLGSGLGLTYEGEGGTPAGPPAFTNTFVNPSAYCAFMQTGRWPDGTVLVLEFRRSQTGTPPNTTGRFQGELVGPLCGP